MKTNKPVCLNLRLIEEKNILWLGVEPSGEKSGVEKGPGLGAGSF